LYGNPQPPYTHNNLIKQQRKNVFIHLPGLKIISITNIEFHFEPCEKYVGLIRNNPVFVNHGITLHFTLKAIKNRIITPKGSPLGCLYVNAQLM